ncbi:MAG: hypothetical protein GY866_39705 [Proteobacteria bacterium]|nr:hypothetical protein [Pseudomonadota bacterium]
MKEKQRTTFDLIVAAILISIAGSVPIGVLSAKDLLDVSSGKVIVDQNKNTLLMKENVSVVLQSNGSTLLADQLLLNWTSADNRWTKAEKAEADGNVTLKIYAASANRKSNDHYVSLTCQGVSFDRKTALFEAKGDVRVEFVDYRLQADRIRYNNKLGKGKITALPGKQVTIAFYRRKPPDSVVKLKSPRDRREIIGTSDEIMIDQPSQKIVLQGQVSVVDTSDQSKFGADRVELFLTLENKIERITADGDFSMTQTGRISKADRAVFEYGKDEVTLIGDALVKEENQIEIKSSRIKMYIEVNRGIIQGGKDVPVEMKIPID